MPNLPRASLGVFSTRSHVEDWSGIHIEACKNTEYRIASVKILTPSRPIQPGPTMVMQNLHLTSLSFNTNVIRMYQLWLELPPPLHRPLDPVLRVVKLPFGGTHVSRVGSRIGEETLFPRVVFVRLWEGDGLGVLPKMH